MKRQLQGEHLGGLQGQLQRQLQGEYHGNLEGHLNPTSRNMGGCNKTELKVFIFDRTMSILIRKNMIFILCLCLTVVDMVVYLVLRNIGMSHLN